MDCVLFRRDVLEQFSEEMCGDEVRSRRPEGGAVEVWRSGSK